VLVHVFFREESRIDFEDALEIEGAKLASGIKGC
jgi:hypothetical protein